jgi:hypothetical protein
MLRRADGAPWVTDNVARPFARAAARAGVGGTLYALRHSSIVRALLAGTPIRLVARMHDTSTPMVERTYSATCVRFP